MTADNSFAEQAYTGLKNDILTCLLLPGSRIAQPELVKRYALGVTPIREALKRLEYEGFVHSLPRYGYLISPITVKDIEDLYNFRMILEQAAVSLAIERATDTQLERLKKGTGFSYVYKNRKSYLDFLDQNTHFHIAIAMAAGNRKLTDVLTTTLNEMIRIFNLGLDLRDSAMEMQREHLDIADALSRRDVKYAQKVIAAQITSSRQRVLEMMAQPTNF